MKIYSHAGYVRTVEQMTNIIDIQDVKILDMVEKERNCCILTTPFAR